MWDDPFPTVEVWEWISNFIQYFIIDVITWPYGEGVLMDNYIQKYTP